MNRREAREQLFTLLFETQFVGGEDYDTVYRDELTLRGLRTMHMSAAFFTA